MARDEQQGADVRVGVILTVGTLAALLCASVVLLLR